ncbi:MAG: DMT family transporter [Clostridium sp.]
MLALPFLLLIVGFRGELKLLFKSIRKNFLKWMLWGNLSGIVFYFLLTISSDFAPSWLVASSWQITIVAGLLLSPLFFIPVIINGKETLIRGKIPLKRLFMSLFILVGVAIMQLNELNTISLENILKGFIPVAIAAFLYPLGNRKLMEVCGDEINSFQRSLGVAIVSMPLAIIFAIIGGSKSTLSGIDFFQALILALFSGVIATITFFFATTKAKHDLSLLAAVESTQAGMVVFTVIGSIIFLNGSFPTGFSLLGIIIIIIGMIVNSFIK